jgi:putative tricarboxylic transport membrane protein
MGDRILAFVMFILGGAFFYFTLQLEEPPLVDPLGIKTFPLLVAVGGFIAGVLLLIEVYRAKRHRETAENENRPLAVFAVLGWMLLTYLLLETLGFAVSITLLLFGMMSFFNRGKWFVNITVSVLFSVGFYLVFTKLIGVPLPRGFWSL